MIHQSQEMKSVSQRDIFTPMFIIALFTVGKGGIHLSVYQQMNRERNYGIFMQLNIIQP